MYIYVFLEWSLLQIYMKTLTLVECRSDCRSCNLLKKSYRFVSRRWRIQTKQSLGASGDANASSTLHRPVFRSPFNYTQTITRQSHRRRRCGITHVVQRLRVNALEKKKKNNNCKRFKLAFIINFGTLKWTKIIQTKKATTTGWANWLPWLGLAPSKS